MTMQIPLRCRCGTVRGVVSNTSAAGRQRAVCYCDDCQIYALHLGRADILDERGGTDSFIATPAQLTLGEGSSQVRCIRLSPKAPYRWYVACCNTPIGNTLRPGLPFLIVLTTALDFAALGTSPDQALGPIGWRVRGAFAKGGVPEGAHAKVPFGVARWFARFLLRGWLKGGARPSPFFDDRGVPRAQPQLIDKGEREALRAHVLAAARA